MTGALPPTDRPGGLGPYRVVRAGGAWAAENAVVLGDVTLGTDANLWFGVVVRGDDAPISIGPRTNVQDGTIVHADPGVAHAIGADITVGHGAILHGKRIEDLVLIGMGAITLAGSIIGEGAVVGAGALVAEHFEVPPYSLVVGVPARVVRTFEGAQRDERRAHALEMSYDYVAQARAHVEGRHEGGVRA